MQSSVSVRYHRLATSSNTPLRLASSPRGLWVGIEIGAVAAPSTPTSPLPLPLLHVLRYASALILASRHSIRDPLRANPFRNIPLPRPLCPHLVDATLRRTAEPADEIVARNDHKTDIYI